MAKYVSNGDKQEDIKHYQKLLIPLNIVVCVMCLVSFFTLMFAPILRIDLAKIVSNPELSSFVKDTISKSLSSGNNNQTDGTEYGNYIFTTAAAADGGNNGNSGSGDGNSSGAGISDEMISTIATSVIDPLLQSVGKSDISLSFTAFSSLKVLTGGSEALKNELSDMVGGFTDGLVDAITNLFADGEIVDTIVEVSLPAIIETSIDTIKNDPETNEEVRQLLEDLTEDQVAQLIDDLKGLQTTKTAQQFIDKIVDIAPNLMLTLTGQNLDDDQIETLRTEITDMVNETVEKVHAQNPDKQFDYNLEAFLCITISQNFDIDDIDNMIKQAMGKDNNNNNNNGSSLASAAETRAEGSDSGNADSGTAEGEKNYTIYTSFSEILSAMESTTTDLSATVREAVQGVLDDLGEDIDTFASLYGILFIVIAVFMVLWLILFLFSLLHIFAKNKRFCMWYVKLLCWIPGIIWLVLTLASMPSIIAMITGMLSLDVPAGVIAAVVGGISSWGTGVSFICYWILWLISIFWAFPIKHKIRKLKKQVKAELKAQPQQSA